MRKKFTLRCINTPLKNDYTHGSWTVGKLYTGYETWYDADAGETEMVIDDDNDISCRYRDYNWRRYFEEV